MPELDRDTALDWIERWDRQQEESLPDREDRFTALIDAVEEGTGRPDPLVLDIGCGPGSLGVRLLARLPRATVIGVDADPVSMTLGRAAYADVPGLRFADLDLRVPGWAARLGLGTRAPDAAVSTTALHWLPEPELRAMYAELASVLRPGGLLLDGDHFALDNKQRLLASGVIVSLFTAPLARLQDHRCNLTFVVRFENRKEPLLFKRVVLFHGLYCHSPMIYTVAAPVVPDQIVRETLPESKTMYCLLLSS